MSVASYLCVCLSAFLSFCLCVCLSVFLSFCCIPEDLQWQIKARQLTADQRKKLKNSLKVQRISKHSHHKSMATFKIFSQKLDHTFFLFPLLSLENKKTASYSKERKKGKVFNQTERDRDIGQKEQRMRGRQTQRQQKTDIKNKTKTSEISSFLAYSSITCKRGKQD